MTEVFNFSAGPAMLPREVLQQAQAELLDWQGTGMSVMEISHRSPEYLPVAEQAERDLRDLLDIPPHYQVLFMQGGATLQFAAAAMNLLQHQAVYLDTGIWSAKAIKEAKRFGAVHCVDAISQIDGRTVITEPSRWNIPEQFDYLHYADNETISGVEFATPPQCGIGRLVGDMSSNILSRPINVADYAMIYAGAQKNIGPAGLTIVIYDPDKITAQAESQPTLLQYQKIAEQQSMLNTPPTFSWYLAGLVFQWIKREGGVRKMNQLANQRAELLYGYLDSSEFYINDIDPSCRSRMNITFRLRNADLQPDFLTYSDAMGLKYLKGHRSVGGLRASCYNAMPIAGVERLIEVLDIFASKHQ